MANTDPTETHSLTDLLDQMADGAEGETITLGDLLDQVGRRAYGPLLFIPALIAVAPTGMVPGMSIVTGSLILLIAGQMLLPLDHPWLPKRLLRIEMRRALFERAIEKTKRVAKRIDRVIKARWVFMAKPPVSYVVAAICVVLAGLMFPFALLPFAVALPGTAIAFFALGITFRDGVLIAVGLAFAAGAAGLAVWLVL
jgi:hypothetical protein